MRPLTIPTAESSDTSSDVHPLFINGALPARAFIHKRKSKFDDFTAARRDVFHLSIIAATTPPQLISLALPPEAGSWNTSYTEMSGDSDAPSSYYSMSRLTASDADKTFIAVYYTADFNADNSPHFDPTSALLAYNGSASSKRWFDLTPSHLKSLLQKNIRMSRAASAARTALQLIATAGMNECARRLSLIMLEDAIIHPHFPLLVWLSTVTAPSPSPPHDTSATFRLTIALVNTVVQIAYDIAAIRIRDPLRDRHFDDSDDIRAPLDTSAVTSAQRTLIRSLHVRAHIGGMPGDVMMVRRFAALWKKRFETENIAVANAVATDVSPSAPTAPVRQWFSYLTTLFSSARSRQGAAAAMDAYSLARLTDDDIMLAAIDYHCSNIVDAFMRSPAKTQYESALNVVGAELSGDSARALLRAIIWRHRSSRTNKSILGGGGDDDDGAEHTSVSDVKGATVEVTRKQTRSIYDAIKSNLDALSRNMIAQRLRAAQ